MKHRFWSLLMSLLLIFTVTYALKQPVAAVSSGSCGADVRWSVSSSGVLTISGTGAMEDYHFNEEKQNTDAPWGQDETITKIVIRDGVTHIGEFAFFRLSNVTEVTLPDTLVEIGGHAFQYLTKLTQISLPKGLTYIGSYAFFATDSLTKVTLPKSVTGLGAAWAGRLAELHVDSLEAWLRIDFGPRDPYGQSSANPLSSGSCKLYIGGKQVTKVKIPEGTEKIKDYAFYGLDSMTEVTIPASVTHIGTGAFWNCDALTEISIPDTVTSLGEQLFMECANLKKVRLPAGITAIPANTFRDCVGLESFTMPSGVDTIGRCAFENCKKLKKFSKDNSLKNVNYIGGSAFIGCTSLEFGHLELSENLYHLGDDYSGYAFAYCDGLTGVTIPGSLYSIGWVAFENCVNLKTVIIQEGVQSIGSHAFAGCTALETVALPQSVTILDRGIFSGCTALTRVDVRNDSLVIPEPFENDRGEMIYPLGDPAVTTLGGRPDSTAQAYAKTYGFPFAELEHTCENGYHNYAPPADHFDCSAPGMVTYTCAECGDSYEEAFYTMGHRLEDGVCVHCGEEFLAAGVWGEDRAFWYIQPDGTLYIYANEMTFLPEGALWEKHADKVTRMVLGQNITGIYLVPPGAPAREPVLYPELTELVLGADVQDFDPSVLNAPKLKTVTVDQENARFFLQEEVLYTYGNAETEWVLVLYPAALENTEFTVPGNVVKVGPRAFANATALESVTFRPDGTVWFLGDLFPGCTGLTTVSIYSDKDLNETGSVEGYKYPLGDPQLVTVLGVADSMTERLAEAYGYSFTPFTVCQLRGEHGDGELRDDRAATCLEPGYTGDTWCVDCGEMIEQGEETELGDHDLIHNPEEPADCLQEGVVEYWKCAVCELEFADEEATTPVEDKLLPALGHDWDPGTEEDRKVTHTCTRCGETMSYVLPPVGMDLHLPEDREGLLDKILTEEEKQLLQQGTLAEAYLTAYDITESLSDEDKQLLEEAQENGTVITVLDIQLMKILGTEDPTPIHETSGQVHIRVRVPEEMREAGDAAVRSFWILRLHEGAVDRLDGIFDPETGYFEFETDRFSAYALVYEDTPIPTTVPPTTEEPTVPTTEEPTVPTTEEPTVPTTEEPTVPTTEEPTVPTTEEPTVPTTEELTVPTTEEPTVPTTEEPAVPTTTVPSTTEGPTEPTEDYGHGGKGWGRTLWIVLELVLIAAAATWAFVWWKTRKKAAPEQEEPTIEIEPAEPTGEPAEAPTEEPAQELSEETAEEPVEDPKEE